LEWTVKGGVILDERIEKTELNVRAVERALDILLAFRPHDDALTVSELLERVDLRRPTLYRLLRTLQSKQFLISSGDPQRFWLGPAVAQLSHVWTTALDLGLLAEPMMRRLWKETGETVALFVPEGMLRVCVAEIPSPQALSFKRGVGYRESLALGASGKAILAHLSALPRERGSRAEPKIDLKKYSREFSLIKERGYAISKNELIQGAIAVSAPFFNGAGECAGSIGVFGPSVRLSDAQITKFGKLLVRVAREISQVLGSVPVSLNPLRLPLS
jgi:IclR family transcriptional regulator, acetate operon repressor